MSAVVAATVSTTVEVVVTLAMEIEVASLIIEVVTVTHVSTRVVVVVAGVVIVVVRRLVVGRGRTVADVPGVAAVAVRVANVQMDIPSAEMNTEASGFSGVGVDSKQCQCGQCCDSQCRDAGELVHNLFPS